MAAADVTKVLSRAPIPAAVQPHVARTTGSNAPYLADNPHLDPGAWEVLYQEVLPAEGVRGQYLAAHMLEGLLDRDLTSTQALRLAEDAAAGRFPDKRQAELVDHALACHYSTRGAPPELTELLARAPGPLVARVLVAAPNVSQETKERVIRHAHIEDRIGWLTTPDAAGLSDDEAWELLAGADTHRLWDDPRRHATQVLYARPGLRSRAARENGELVRLVVRVPLSEDDQLVALARLTPHAHLLQEEKEALQVLATAPWCTQRVRARISVHVPLAEAPFGTGLDLRTLPWWKVRKLVYTLTSKRAALEAATTKGWPYVLAELVQNPSLRGRARTRAIELLTKPGWMLGDVGGSLLAQLGAGAQDSRNTHPFRLRPVERVGAGGWRPQSDPWDTAKALATPATAASTDALSAAFSTLGPDPAAWETALVLLEDDHHGTLGQLLETARLLTPVR